MKREFKEILIKLFIKDSERFRKRNEEITRNYQEKMQKINEHHKLEQQKINKEIKLEIDNIKNCFKDSKKEIIESIKPLNIKTGIRRPSISKSIKARTTAKAKRKLNSTINPLYGQKGMGWVNNPKRALYNKTYHKTTFSSKKLFK